MKTIFSKSVNDNNEAESLRKIIREDLKDFYEFATDGLETESTVSVVKEWLDFEPNLVQQIQNWHRTELIRQMEEERRRLKQILTTKDNYFDFGDAVNNYIMDLGQRISEMKGEKK